MNPEQTPAFIDFEASSLDLVASYPIEVGVCLPDGSIHSWLIRPHVLWQDWSESAEKIHGLPRQRLIEEGLEVSEVTAELNRLLPDTVYCDAWTFDSFWLHRLYRAANKRPRFQLESVSMILDAQEVGQWAERRKDAVLALGVQTHRAANDALILHETWRRVIAGRPSRANA